MGWSWNPHEAYRRNGCGNPVDREGMRYDKNGKLIPDYRRKAVIPPDYRRPSTMPPSIRDKQIAGYTGLTTLPYIRNPVK